MWSIVDFILNVAGLLLWLNLRSIRFDPFTRAVPATLAGTLRRAEPARMRRWHFLAALGGLLLVRALFYWQVGPALDLVPSLDLVLVALAFRGDAFGPVLLFSVLSFARALMVFYFWLIFLGVVNRRRENDPFQKAIELQLGRIARRPWFVQLLLPIFAVATLWIVLHPVLVQAGVMNRTHSNLHLAEQGLLIGAMVYCSLKFLLPALFLAQVIASYVYLGNHPLWDFIGATSRNVLAPLNRLPLRSGKMDFAPLLGILLVLLVLHFLPEWIRAEMMRRGWPVWPP